MADGSSNTAWSAARAAEIIAERAQDPGALLPLLHMLQAAFGHVPDEATPLLAQALNLSRADVHGVLTFYRDFRRAPVNGSVVRLCRAEACQARGGRETERELAMALGPDSKVSLEGIYCLGLCASGPAALVDGRPLARLTGARLTQLIGELRK